ncbi:MAG: hypothetical protein C0P66_011200, partial [Bacillaceae bacterium]
INVWKKFLNSLISIIRHRDFFDNTRGLLDLQGFHRDCEKKNSCRRSPGVCALLGVDDNFGTRNFNRSTIAEKTGKDFPSIYPVINSVAGLFLMLQCDLPTQPFMQ